MPPSLREIVYTNILSVAFHRRGKYATKHAFFLACFKGTIFDRLRRSRLHALRTIVEADTYLLHRGFRNLVVRKTPLNATAFLFTVSPRSAGQLETNKKIGQMRVLIVSPIEIFSARFSILLKQLDYAADIVLDEDDAQAAMLTNTYDVVALDIDSISICFNSLASWIRQTQPELRILVCKSRDNLDSVMTALANGADEFLVKPIDKSELKIRLSRLESSQKTIESDDVVLDYGPLRVDFVTRQVWLGGNHLELTPRERSVLQVLLRHRGNVVSKDYIASRVFSMEDDATPSAIEIYVHRLRRKTSHPALKIKTVRGLGYQLEARPLAAA